MKAIVSITLLSMFLLGGVASGFEPIWELDLTVTNPVSATISTPIGDQPFWYIIYAVKNPHNEPREIRPAWVMSNDKGETVHEVYQPEVLAVVKQRTELDLLNVTNSSATLKAGETKRGVAVFPMPNRESRRLVFSGRGFSGNRVESRDGVVGISSRIYRMSYTIQGDQYFFTPARLNPESRRYVNSFRTVDEIGEVTYEDDEEDIVVKTADVDEDAAPAQTLVAPVEIPVVRQTPTPVVTAAKGSVASPFDLLPGGWDIAARLDVKKIVAIEEVGQNLEAMGAAEQLKQQGIESLDDLDAVIVAMKLNPFGMADAAFVVTGKFDDAALTGEGIDEAEKYDYKGVQIAQTDVAAAAILDAKHVILASSDEILKGMIDVFLGDSEPAFRQSDTYARVRDLDTAMVWFTMLVDLDEDEADALMESLPLPGFDPTLIRNITLSINVLEEIVGIKAAFGCENRDGAEATEGAIRQAVNMGMGLLAMAAGQDENAGKLLKVLQDVKAGSSGNAATLELAIGFDVIRELAGQAMGMFMMGGMGGGQWDDDFDWDDDDFEVEVEWDED